MAVYALDFENNKISSAMIDLGIHKDELICK